MTMEGEPMANEPGTDDQLLATLKPCPICGDQPRWRGTSSDYKRGLARLQCLGETHLVQSYGPSEAAAIAAWNTRTEGDE